MKCITTTLKLAWKVSFSGSNWLFYNFESLNNIFSFEQCSKSKWEILREIIEGSNSDALKTALRGLLNFQNSTPLFASSWKVSRHSSVIFIFIKDESITNGSVG